jgi:hypothetical protein
MIIFTAEIAEELMKLGFDPIGEVNGFWEFEDSVRLEAVVSELVEGLVDKDL